MNYHFQMITGTCVRCREDAELVQVCVSSKFELMFRWECEICGNNIQVSWTFQKLKEIAEEIRVLEEEEIKGAGKFTKEDDAYLGEMGIGGGK